MIIIDNNYMINERAVDVRSLLKSGDNASNIAEIFFKNLSYRVYDYVIDNSINFGNRTQIDDYLYQNDDFVEDFKRALAEQAMYIFSIGDINYMIPNEFDYPKWLNYETWKQMAVCPATVSILDNLGLLRKAEAL